MPVLETWVVFNKTTGRVDVIKTKRAAVRAAELYKKLYDILNIESKILCFEVFDFFNTHLLVKENIHFSWPIQSEEKMYWFQQFYKGKPL